MTVTDQATSVSELTATNFKLSLEVRSLRADLTQLKALRKYENSLEVDRIKSAYEQLENEVVELRKQKIRRGEEIKLEEERCMETRPIQSMQTPSPDSDIITVLKDQLRSEREKYKLLELKYDQLRRDFGAATNSAATGSVAYSDDASGVSTSVGGSPPYRDFSIEKYDVVIIKPQLEEVFKRPISRQRPVLPLVEIVPTKSSGPSLPASQPPPPQSTRSTSSKRDPSIQRLAKIAKYRGSH